jgi:hypothetical protein
MFIVINIAETYVCKLFTKGKIKNLSDISCDKSVGKSELQFAFEGKYQFHQNLDAKHNN